MDALTVRLGWVRRWRQEAQAGLDFIERGGLWGWKGRETAQMKANHEAKLAWADEKERQYRRWYTPKP